MNKNPFTLMYGVSSESVLVRENEVSKIVNSFSNESIYAYLITGLRGSGKTVLLRTIEERLHNDNGWIVVNINPQGRIITSLANRLYDRAVLSKIIGKWTLTVNLEVLTLTRENGEKTNDPEIIVEHLLKRYKKKILISIDEVNDTPDFREFINFYQTLIGKGYPVYLLMTALKENINGLINDKAMTFLSRTPKVELKPLELTTIAKEYQRFLNVDLLDSVAMAKLTQGYAFAYQVLGYLLFSSNKKKLDKEIIDEYEKYLWSNGYAKFYNDLTEVEKNFVLALAKTKGDKESIIDRGHFSISNYSVYRARLIEKGLIYSPKYGYLDFVLPRFKEFVLLRAEFEQ